MTLTLSCAAALTVFMMPRRWTPGYFQMNSHTQATCLLEDGEGAPRSQPRVLVLGQQGVRPAPPACRKAGWVEGLQIQTPKRRRIEERVLQIRSLSGSGFQKERVRGCQ